VTPGLSAAPGKKSGSKRVEDEDDDDDDCRLSAVYCPAWLRLAAMGQSVD